ncbi:MAG: OB-fold nucleic acid binding protein, partial [uncultured bacterium]
SGLSLNNGGETVSLLDPTGAVMDSVTYSDAQTGQSYAIFSDGWQWTTTLTNGAVNIFTTDVSTETTDSSSSTGDGTTSTGESQVTGDSASDIITTQTIAEIKLLDSGADVYTQGTVSALPEIFSSNYFYIQDDTGGIQVYSADKDFPTLAVGDVVTVTGSRGTSSGEAKINIATAEDIVIIAQNQAITPAADLSDTTTNAGRLVITSGTISLKSGSTITLDTGTALYIKRGTGISTASFIQDEYVSVIGVLVVTDDGVQVWPRSTADVVFGVPTETGSGTITTDQSIDGSAQNNSGIEATDTAIRPIEQTITSVAPYWPWLALGFGLVSLGLGRWLWQNTRLRDWVRARAHVLEKLFGHSAESEKNTTDSNGQSQYHESHLWGKINV